MCAGALLHIRDLGAYIHDDDIEIKEGPQPPAELTASAKSSVQEQNEQQFDPRLSPGYQSKVRAFLSGSDSKLITHTRIAPRPALQPPK